MWSILWASPAHSFALILNWFHPVVFTLNFMSVIIVRRVCETTDAGPTPRVSDSQVRGGAQRCAPLPSTQVRLLDRGPHLQTWGAPEWEKEFCLLVLLNPRTECSQGCLGQLGALHSTGASKHSSVCMSNSRKSVSSSSPQPWAGTNGYGLYSFLF